MKRETYKALQKIFGSSEDLFAQETVEDNDRYLHQNTGSDLLPFQIFTPITWHGNWKIKWYISWSLIGIIERKSK